MKKSFLSTLLLLLWMGLTASATPITDTFSSQADTFLRDAVVRGADSFMDIRGGSVDFAGYLRFDLSSLAAIVQDVSQIQNVSLKLTVSGGASRNDTLTTGRFALYGLNNVAGNTPQDWDEATLSETGSNPVGLEWNNVVPMDLSSGRVTDLDMESVPGITEVLNPPAGSSAPGTTITISGAPLAAFLQSRISDNGLVTFILTNKDAADRGYGIATKENSNSDWHPVLQITYIPEPATLALVGLGGLISLRRRG